MAKRELWGTRIGLILAMAGNAVGLGNFLRFPVQAAQNGGGAFMIPYFAAFLLLGIPLMWAEWSMGRLGGTRNHGTTPYIFHTLWRNPATKYIGVLGVVLPLGIAIYYVCIESWTMAFAYFSSVERYWGITTIEPMRAFLQSFQGVGSSEYFDGFEWAYLFFVLTMAINAFVLFRGVRSGIEILAKVAMPLLFLFAIGVAIRVATLGLMDTPPPHSIEGGFAFIWNPDLSRLGESGIWLAAAGQIFFTLSLAMGCIQVYASYLNEKDDLVMTGFTTAITNEFVEVVLGASIAIPVAFAFFGAIGTQEIAQGGSFNLGFAAMPVIFQQIPLGAFFGTLWFGLLFFAGITSSVALMTPAIAFLQDEFGWSRRKAVAVVVGIVFAAAHLIIFGLGHGTLDEMDFWCGTFGLALGALIESVMFFWIFGMDNAWRQLHLGAERRVPRFFYPIMKVVTPLYCLVLFAAWGYQNGWDVLTMKNVAEADRL
ncbi:MAG: sodium-dependent transporter, partial [Bradymonadales bacterium]|nr:sodium-dependent transporter [Bradymonadales bacterium]